MDELNDGSVDTAAMAIAAAREADPPAEADAPAPAAPERKEPARGADGKFQKAGDGTEAESDDTGADSGQEAKADDEDEDYLELEVPGEEGKEPTRERFKVSDVFAGFQRAKELEAELEQAKTRAPLPADVESEINGLIAERTRYVEALQSWSQFNQPRAPSRDLINPQSASYNPELYYSQMQAFDEVQANHARIREEIERVQKQNEEKQNALLGSKMTRERAKLAEVWPELVKDKAVAQKFVADLQNLYGVDGETLASVSDHRFYALAKDALAFRAAQAAKKEAARVVLAKPKLVRANARSSTNSKATAFQGAMGKLSHSHSLDDAAAAIAALR